MANISTCPPLTRRSVEVAHERIKDFIHLTPVVTSATIDTLASTAQCVRCPSTGLNTLSEPAPHSPHPSSTPTPATARPQLRIFFKCENQQRIGAFKARGAFHALGRLIEERGLESVRRTGVVTHSSGNHAQALALAAKTHSIPAHIIMPTISTPSKISGTRSHGAEVIFSGSTSDEREAVLHSVIARTHATFIPPYDHPDVILGQGTVALEFEAQVSALLNPSASRARTLRGAGLDAVICPIGGGGLCSGIATALHGTSVRVFGAEPSFEGANDAERGLREGKRVEKVKSLTIADGVRTPVGEIPWGVISDREKVGGVWSVSEEEIKAALRVLMERAKVFVEPTSAVALAVVLYNEDFRRYVEKEAGEKGWNLGVVLSGGNTTMEALAKLFATGEKVGERAEGTVGVDGGKEVENVAG